MNSISEESMLIIEKVVPIDKYKKATKHQYHFLYIDKPSKTYKGIFIKHFNLI